VAKQQQQQQQVEVSCLAQAKVLERSFRKPATQRGKAGLCRARATAQQQQQQVEISWLSASDVAQQQRVEDSCLAQATVLYGGFRQPATQRGKAGLCSASQVEQQRLEVSCLAQGP
jgi:hypothetical protein